MKRQYIISTISLSLLFAMSGCDKVQESYNNSPDRKITFQANVDGTGSLTKGTLINTTSAPASLSDYVTTFYVKAYNGTSQQVPSTGTGYEQVSYANSAWTTSKAYKWPENATLSFFAYANKPVDATITCNSDGQSITGYTVAAAHTAQQDFLLGYYKGNGGTDGVASLTFKHALTAVRFKLSTAVETTVNSVKSIKLENVYKTGNVTHSSSGISWVANPTIEDSNHILQSNLQTVSMSPTGTSTTLSLNSGTYLLSDSNGDGTFILIPQNLSTVPVTVVIEATVGGEDVMLSTTLETGSWKAGTVYTYELRIYDNFKLQVVNVDDWENDDDYNRSDYITRGAAIMTGFVEKLYKSISQAKYGHSDGCSKADITTISFQTGMPLEDEAVIQRYDTEDNVIPGWFRLYDGSTDKKVVYMGKIQEDQYTLYKRSEPIYSFCDAEGNCIICTTADVIYFPISCESLFDGCTNLTSITGRTGGTTIPGDGFTSGTALTDGLSNVRTDHTTSMKYMFGSCTSLTELNVPFNTSKVNDMQYTFYNCKLLTTINGIENWSGNAVQRATGMFYKCQELTALDLSNFETTSSLKDVKYMFYNCEKVTEIDLSSSFNTTGVTDMTSMFESCKALVSINGINSLRGTAVTTTKKMFYQCNALTALDLSKFITTTSLTDVEYMFNGCNNLSTLNISGLNTSNVTSFNRLFYECYALSSLYVGQGFTIDNSPTNPPTIQYIVYHTSYDSTTSTYQKCKVYCPDDIWNTTWKTIETGKTYTGATAQDTRWNKNMFTHITWTN